MRRCGARDLPARAVGILVPVLDRLTEEKWSACVDGSGALNLTPTRELTLWGIGEQGGQCRRTWGSS